MMTMEEAGAVKIRYNKEGEITGNGWNIRVC